MVSQRNKPNKSRTKKKAKKEHKNSPTSKCTPEMIELTYRLALLGLNEKEIAGVLNIGLSTLEKYKRNKKKFREALFNGKEVANANIAHSLYQKGIGYQHKEDVISIYKGSVIKTETIKHYPPDTKACYLFLKNRTRNHEEPWSDLTRVEHTGKGGEPIQMRTIKGYDEYDLKDLNKEELKTALTLFPQLESEIKKALTDGRE